MEGTSDIPLNMLPSLKAAMAVMVATEQKDAQKASGGMASMGNRTPRPTAPRLESFPEPDNVELLTELPPEAAMRQEAVRTNTKPINQSNIEKSNLSPEIKKLMMEHQIDDPATYVSPELDIAGNTRTDLMGITEDVAPKTKPLNEYKSAGVSIAEPLTNYAPPLADADAIRKLVQEEVLQIMSETYVDKVRKKAIEDTMRILKSKGLLK